MTDETPAAARDYSVHPASLKPLSPGCLVPVALAVVMMGLAYIGLQKIVNNTGPWALSAAENALADSGIPEDQRVAFALEVARLRAAFEAETLESADVVNGVAGLLETPTLPLLIVDDVIDRRLPESNLTDEEKTEVIASLTTFKAAADGRVLKYQALLEVLGPLARTEEEGGPQAELSDAELLEMSERAQAVVADEKVPKLDEEPTYEVLLERYRAHVGAVLNGTAEVIERSQ